jgi:tetratricopeptide (TPR) repeat protein
MSREQTASLLDLPPATLNNDQRSRVDALAIDIALLAEVQRDQGRKECLENYQEALELFERTGARQREANIAYNLGWAYTHIPSLRDLDSAELWYRRSLEFRAEGDALGRARSVGQLGSVAHERYLEGRRAGVDDAELVQHLHTAAASYHEALDLLPEDAVSELAIAHNTLGIIYVAAGQVDVALPHWREAIRQAEAAGDRYEAGQARSNIAIGLADAGRFDDALLYANAAVRDFESVGVWADTDLNKAQRLIHQIQETLATSEKIQ